MITDVPCEESPEEKQPALSFAVIGADGHAIGPASFSGENFDIGELLEKKYDTDESIQSDSESTSSPLSNVSPKVTIFGQSNDSGIEMCPFTPSKLSLPLIFPKFDSSYHNTGRFYSSSESDNSDSENSMNNVGESEEHERVTDIPLRSIHNCSNSANSEWESKSLSDAINEYEGLRDAKPTGSLSTSKRPFNKSRNRYTDVPCYDHTRVKIRGTITYCHSMMTNH